MSRTLFDQTLAPRQPNPKRRGTVFVSVALHALGLAVLLALGVRAEAPVVNSKMILELAPPVKMPEAPPPAQPKVMATQAVHPDAAPPIAPDSITPEPATPPPMLTAVYEPTAGVPGSIGDKGTTIGAPPQPPAPGPTPPPPAPRRVGGDIQAPQRISAVAPDYPQVARIAKIEGVVTLEATIDAQGQVRDVKVIGSIPLLDKAAVDAVSKWKYTPTRLNGEAISVILTVRVVFSLR
ncbi:MAG TPA: TonB family protein [Vicinamibacterales bacterium]|nr:TonB family protein [Vicinamibacterales bacterium]